MSSLNTINGCLKTFAYNESKEKFTIHKWILLIIVVGVLIVGYMESLIGAISRDKKEEDKREIRIDRENDIVKVTESN